MSPKKFNSTAYVRVNDYPIDEKQGPFYVPVVHVLRLPRATKWKSPPELDLGVKVIVERGLEAFAFDARSRRLVTQQVPGELAQGVRLSSSRKVTASFATELGHAPPAVCAAEYRTEDAQQQDFLQRIRACSCPNADPKRSTTQQRNTDTYQILSIDSFRCVA